MTRKGFFLASGFWGLFLGLLIIQPVEAFSPVLRQPVVFSFGHIAGFAVFSLLLSLHFGTGGLGGHVRNPFLAIAAAAAVCAVCGLFTEFLQSYSPGRSPSWSDFCQDMAGAFAGALAYFAIRFSRPRSSILFGH